MQPVISAWILVGLACGLGQSASTLDLRVEQLNVLRDSKRSTLIVLAFPIARRDTGLKVTYRRPGLLGPIELTEVETTLQVLTVIKGSRSVRTVYFRFCDSRELLLMGPPTGPSGKFGDPGIFFLRSGEGNVLRSVIDVYRPDIETRWISNGKSWNYACLQDESQCIASLLMTVREGDDAQRFAAALHDNRVISQALLGFLGTLEYLTKLSNAKLWPSIRRSSCVEISKIAVLELQGDCLGLIPSAALEEYRARIPRTRDALIEGGAVWIKNRIGSDREAEVSRYLRILGQSADSQTRVFADKILSDVSGARSGRKRWGLTK